MLGFLSAGLLDALQQNGLPATEQEQIADTRLG